MALELCLDSLNFLKIQGRVFLSRRTAFKEVKIGRSRPMKGRHLIHCCDEALIDRNGVIISHPSDKRRMVEMSLHRTCEEMRRFLSFVGSSSCVCD